MDKTLILSERHCSVLELNEVVIGLSGKGWRWGGLRLMFGFNEKVLCEYGPLDIFWGEALKATHK